MRKSISKLRFRRGGHHDASDQTQRHAKDRVQAPLLQMVRGVDDADESHGAHDEGRDGHQCRLDAFVSHAFYD